MWMMEFSWWRVLHCASIEYSITYHFSHAIHSVSLIRTHMINRFAFLLYTAAYVSMSFSCGASVPSIFSFVSFSMFESYKFTKKWIFGLALLRVDVLNFSGKWQKATTFLYVYVCMTVWYVLGIVYTHLYS